MRLAQRVPVRIHIDSVPPTVRLVQGMTATVEVDVPPGTRAEPVPDTGTAPGAGHALEIPDTGPCPALYGAADDRGRTGAAVGY